MSNMFSCFWIAEAYEPYLMTQHPKEVAYIVTTADKFNHININISSLTKKIVGTISLSKHQKLNGSAWIKRLYVHEQYRRKGIATCLLNVAVEFAVKNRYRYAEIAASEYTKGGKELCRKSNFLLKQRYHKHVLGPYVTIMMSIYTFPIFGRSKCVP
jgi:GNAT superfamily N-acetyltransferase